MAALIKQNGPVSKAAEYLGKAERPLGRGADLVRQQPFAALRPHRPDEAACRARRHQDVPGRRAARQGAADKWTWDFFSQAAEKCHKAGYPFGMPISTVQRRGAMGRRDVQRPRRAAGRRQGRHHRQKRRDAGRCSNGSRRLVPFFPEERLCLGRRLEQQGADLGPERADLQRALGLGGGQARRAEGRRAIVDLPAAEGSEGPARLRPLPLLGDLELLAEQGGGEKPAAASVEQRLGREAGRRRARASTSRPSRSCADFKSGRRPRRPRARSTISRRAAMSIVSVAGHPAPAKIGGRRCTRRARCAR